MTTGRVSVIALPFIFRYWTYYTTYLSTQLIGACLLVGSLLLIWLPETLNSDMIESSSPAIVPIPQSASSMKSSKKNIAMAPSGSKSRV